jgi:hypothetical protein
MSWRPEVTSQTVHARLLSSTRHRFAFAEPAVVHTTGHGGRTASVLVSSIHVGPTSGCCRRRPRMLAAQVVISRQGVVRLPRASHLGDVLLDTVPT